MNQSMKKLSHLSFPGFILFWWDLDSEDAVIEETTECGSVRTHTRTRRPQKPYNTRPHRVVLTDIHI